MDFTPNEQRVLRKAQQALENAKSHIERLNFGLAREEIIDAQFNLPQDTEGGWEWVGLDIENGIDEMGGGS